MYSMPAFRSQDNVVGSVARKSRDTWLSLMVALKVWYPAVIVTAVSRAGVGVVTDPFEEGDVEEGADEEDRDGAAEPAGASASDVVVEQAFRVRAADRAAKAARVFFMACPS